MATYNQLIDMGLTPAGARAALDAEALESYDRSTGTGGDLAGSRNMTKNLLSAIEGMTTRVTSEPGTFSPEVVERAQQIRNQLQAEGGIDAV